MKAILFVVVLFITLLTRFISSLWAPTPQPVTLAWSPAPTHTPTPTPAPMPPVPQILEPNYSNPDTGLSLWYPNDWTYRDFVEEVVFASSEEIIMGTELRTGAAMMVTRSELGGPQTLEDLLETTLSELFFHEVEISDQKPHTISGHRGILVTLEGTPEGADILMKGFVAGVEHEDWGYFFMAAAMEDEWRQHGPVLEAMLNSVCLESTRPIFTSPALGLSMRYPEDWLYEDAGDQVIFGTSEEIISGADFESGAAMVIIGSPLDDPPTVEEMVESLLSELFFNNIELSDVKPRTIGDQRGMLVNFEGTPEGEDIVVRGFLAGAEYKGWGYLFFGVSVQDEWCDYEPVLDSMLDSVQFTGR